MSGVHVSRDARFTGTAAGDAVAVACAETVTGTSELIKNTNATTLRIALLSMKRLLARGCWLQAVSRLNGMESGLKPVARSLESAA